MYVFSQYSYGSVIKLTSEMGDQSTGVLCDSCSITKEVYAKANSDLGLRSC